MTGRTQLFMSHTKLDRQFCNSFDIIASRIGIKIFRSEFEEIKRPAWQTIRNEINNSIALFLLVGKELVKAQRLSETSIKASEKWTHTQNWIAFEIGVACHKGIDVWVICDNVTINFPVPYLNHYEIWGIDLDDEDAWLFYKTIFNLYAMRGQQNKPYNYLAEKSKKHLSAHTVRLFLPYIQSYLQKWI